MASIKGDDGSSGLAVPPPGTYGVLGDAGAPGTGVVGLSSGSIGVYGESGYVGAKGVGFIGLQANGSDLGVEALGGRYGVIAQGSTVGVSASAAAGGVALYGRSRPTAGYFEGQVVVTDSLYKAGGSFRIDHPADPENKYLEHSFVESPDRKNVYDGIAVLGGNGEVEVELPRWFAILNGDFRYQLTCLGAHAPVFVAKEIAGNSFQIAGGPPGLKISWQVTGIRQDPWAKANPLTVESDKPAAERGFYLHPELYGQPAEKNVRRALFPTVPEPPRRQPPA